MQLHALTAGTALVLAQLCVALVMAGIFSATRHEACTRSWALSGLSVALGVLLVIVNGGAPRPAILFVGNGLLILGVILQWQGIRAFYGKPRGRAAWIVGLTFFVLFALALWRGASAAERALLVALTILILLVLIFLEFLRSQGPHRTFAGLLALGASGFLVAGYACRTALPLFGTSGILPQSNSALSVALIYLLPTAGSILLFAALSLLYFERIVAAKHHLATHDELTGLLNRRAIVAAGEREIALAMRMGTPFALAFVDIDHFKQINDRLGHAAGDRVIAEVARVLGQTCRNIDLVGRYGGEEFCIALPGVDTGAAALIGQRLVEAVRQHRFSDGIAVTISVGVATLDKKDPHWPALIRRADHALYEAKSRGRNGFVNAACS